MGHESDRDAVRGEGAEMRTFLFADLRGFTRYTQELGDDAASRITARFAAIVRDAMPELGGELLEASGDEVVCVFRSARRALRAAVDLQRRFRERVDDEWVLPLGVGVGLDAGEAVSTDGGYRGRAVNFAARLCGAAGRGEVLASEGLAHLAHPVEGIRFGPVRQLRLKGAPEPVRVVAVEPETPLPPLPPPLPPVRRRRRDVRLLAAGALLVAAIAIAVVTLHHGGAQAARFGRGVPVRANSVAVIDPKDGRVIRDIPVGRSPWDITAGFHALWVVNADDGTVSRIDPGTMRTAPIGVGGSPTAITAGDGSVWVFDGANGTIYQIDPSDDSVRGTFPVPACRTAAALGYRSGCSHAGIAAGAGHVWVTDSTYTVYALDTQTRGLTVLDNDAPAHAVVYAGDDLFTTNSSILLGIDPSSGTHTQGPLRITSGWGSQAHSTLGIAATPTELWLASPDQGTVTRVDRGTFATSGEVRLTPGLNEIAVAPGSVWVTNEGTGRLIEIDPTMVKFENSERLGEAPTAIAIADGRLWVTVQDPKTAANQL
jgi:YVTN family beta-propeller protein